MNEEYYVKQLKAMKERDAATVEALMNAKTIRFVNTEPTPAQTWEHFWKRFFQVRDKHR